MFRHPINGLIELEKIFFNFAYFNKPSRNGEIIKRGFATEAVRIRVNNFFLGQKQSACREIFHNQNIARLMSIFGLYFYPRKIRDIGDKFAVRTDMADKWNVVFLGKFHVLFAISRSQMNDAGAGFSRYIRRGINLPCVFFVRQIIGQIV